MAALHGGSAPPRLSVVHFHTGGRATSLFVAGEYTPRPACQAASRPHLQLTRQLRGTGVEDGLDL
jgi:hypothetical protein